jgi:hypothetical protein
MTNKRYYYVDDIRETSQACRESARARERDQNIEADAISIQSKAVHLECRGCLFFRLLVPVHCQLVLLKTLVAMASDTAPPYVRTLVTESATRHGFTKTDQKPNLPDGHRGEQLIWIHLNPFHVSPLAATHPTFPAWERKESSHRLDVVTFWMTAGLVVSLASMRL